MAKDEATTAEGQRAPQVGAAYGCPPNMKELVAAFPKLFERDCHGFEAPFTPDEVPSGVIADGAALRRIEALEATAKEQQKLIAEVVDVMDGMTTTLENISDVLTLMTRRLDLFDSRTEKRA